MAIVLMGVNDLDPSDAIYYYSFLRSSIFVNHLVSARLRSGPVYYFLLASIE